MKSILIVGQGAIGTFVGAALRSSDCLVDHYVREATEDCMERIECAFVDRRKKSYRLKKGTHYDYRVKRSLENLDLYDFIVIPVGHRQFRNVIDMLNRREEKLKTLVLMGNTWKDFEWFRDNIKCSYLYAFPNFGGVRKDGKLHGWLTKQFTIGSDNEAFSTHARDFAALLENRGFEPHLESNMVGWLMTHFAYNAGMLLEAARNGGFKRMSKRFSSLRRMYATIREGLQVVEGRGINPREFAEGRRSFRSMTWNICTTYLLFLLPGMAKSADAGMDTNEWISYAKEIRSTAQQLSVEVPLIKAGLNKFEQS